MELSYLDPHQHARTLVAQPVDTVASLSSRIREQLGLDKDVEVVLTWGNEQLIADTTIESFLEYVECDDHGDEKALTIHVLFYGSNPVCPDGHDCLSKVLTVG